MKNFITTLTKGTLTGGVFFGTATVILDSTHRSHRFNVTNHLEDLVGKKVKFRWINKVKAGWNTIQEFEAKPEEMVDRISGTVQCIQVMGQHGIWVDIYNLKGGLWASIDYLFLERCTVGDIRQGAPKMACSQTWGLANAKTWADKAFIKNK